MPVAVVLMTHGHHHVGYGILLFASLGFLAFFVADFSHQGFVTMSKNATVHVVQNDRTYNFTQYYRDIDTNIEMTLEEAHLCLLNNMLAGDALMRKDGFLFAGEQPRWYLYGQILSESDIACAEDLIKCVLITPMSGPSPAVVQYGVIDVAFTIAKDVKRHVAAKLAEPDLA
jgi:hypothetical protein